MTEPVVRQRIGDGFGGRYRVRSTDRAAGSHEAPVTLFEERPRLPQPCDGIVFERFVLEKGTRRRLAPRSRPLPPFDGVGIGDGLAWRVPLIVATDEWRWSLVRQRRLT